MPRVQSDSIVLLHRSLSYSQPLSQELSFARTREASVSSSSHSPSSSHSFATIHSAPPTRPDLSIVLSPAQERSTQSLETEIMRLQEVLKERETEISLLEESLKELQGGKHINGINEIKQHDTLTVNGVNGDVSEPAQYLTPRTLHQFDDLRDALVNGTGQTVLEDGRGKTMADNDESLERLNELML